MYVCVSRFTSTNPTNAPNPTPTQQHKTDERALKKFFTQFGKVRSVVMLRDKATNRHKGFAYVEMADLEAIPAVLLMNEQVRLLFAVASMGGLVEEGALDGWMEMDRSTTYLHHHHLHPQPQTQHPQTPKHTHTHTQVPDFQKFPVKVAASQAEKNYLAKQEAMSKGRNPSGPTRRADRGA